MSHNNSVKWWLIVIATLFSLISITTTATMTNSIVQLPPEIRRAFFFRNFTSKSPIQVTQPTTYHVYDFDSNFSFNSLFSHCEVYSFFDQKLKDFPNNPPRNSSIDLYTTFYDILKDQTHFNDYNNFWPPKAIVSHPQSQKSFNAVVKLCNKWENVPCLIIAESEKNAAKFNFSKQYRKLWLCSHNPIFDTS